MCWPTLPVRNENAPIRISPCAPRASHFSRAKFIPKFSDYGEKLSSQIAAIAPICFETEVESNMIKKLLGAAAMAAIISSSMLPASAASMAGCSGANLEKTEAAVENMADGDGKITAQKEVAMAQTAMLDGKMGACAMHLGKAMHSGMTK
ncbi:hypothetical protein [Bradyrhizobium sp.]|uniref:hypothetical protein n=1 Tax=Bradyrhizobium sp. TaxID=376 RepID=UPI003C1A6BE3